MTKRLFIAADIDATTREQIAALSTAVRQSIASSIKASWVRPDRMHLTLRFFGAADDATEERIRAALSVPVSMQPFDVVLDGLGFFPERGSPRVLWVGIGRGREHLQRVHHYLQALLPGSSGEAFTPHLTLARFRERVGRAGLAEVGRIRASAGPSLIDRVTLYESRLLPAGPAYLPLAEAPLTCPTSSSS